MEDDQESPTSPPHQQVRLMMLTVPRSTATVLANCLSRVEDSLVFYELYLFLYALHSRADDAACPQAGPGEDQEDGTEFELGARELLRAELGDAGHGYRAVKERLEQPRPGKTLVFCKDMAYALTGHEEHLPEGYRYLIFIRHPAKVFLSWKRLADQFYQGVRFDQIHRSMLPTGYGFRELSAMLDRVRSTGLDPEPIVIDADDLLARPGPVLAALFQRLGLPFRDSLLSWEAGEAVVDGWETSDLVRQAIRTGHFYKRAFESTGFLEPGDLPDRSSLPPGVLHCVDASMPYYEKMYAQRLKPE